MLRHLYSLATAAAAPGLRIMLRRRAVRGKEVRARLPERMGIEAGPRPPGPLLWLHAASVGEAVSVLGVVDAFLRVMPDAHVLMTTGTVTSAGLLAERLPAMGLGDRVTHRFVPLDVPGWTARFLDHWRPDAAGFVESEIWPNLLSGCAARGIPTLLVNARMSERSFRGWHRVPGLSSGLFGSFAHVLAQSGHDAERLRRLGARHVESPGNLKFAAPPLSVDATEHARLAALIRLRPVWLAASTHPGEEAIAASVHARLAPRHPGLLTIVAPRHPQRGGDIARALAAPHRGAGEDPPDRTGIWVADTMGELGLFYRLAPTVFVGGSLIPHGGQNPLEPARLGCALAVGPHCFNFADPVATLLAAGALEPVSDTESLTRWVDAMLQDPAERSRRGDAAQAAASGAEHLPEQVACILAAALRRDPPGRSASGRAASGREAVSA